MIRVLQSRHLGRQQHRQQHSIKHLTCASRFPWALPAITPCSSIGNRKLQRALLFGTCRMLQACEVVSRCGIERGNKLSTACWGGLGTPS